MPTPLNFNVSRALDENGNPLPGAKAYFYQTGTTTPITVYSDEAETTPHATPVVADSEGVFPTVYYSAAQCKVTVTDASGAVLTGYPLEAAGSFGTIATQDADAVAVTGGTINNTPIGGTTAAAGAFTTLAASGAATLASTLKIGATDPVAAAKQTFLTGGTVGGTADAVTLTTGLSLPALVTGMSARAMLTSTNTTAMTLNVDGLGAVAVKTVPAAIDGLKKDTPAGYIRTDVPTDLFYDGTNWVAGRADESGTDWARYANGRQIAWGGASGGSTVTFGKAFSSVPTITGLAPASTAAARMATYGNTTTGSVDVFGWTDTGGANIVNIKVSAEGYWFQ